jgi:hypothetical protein
VTAGIPCQDLELSLPRGDRRVAEVEHIWLAGIEKAVAQGMRSPNTLAQYRGVTLHVAEHTISIEIDDTDRAPSAG